MINFKWLVVGSGIAIVTLLIFFTASSLKKISNRYLQAKKVNLIIRQIGHQLLLLAGDPTSRVLLGHFNIKTTERYLYVSREGLGNIVSPLDYMWKR